MSDAIDKAEAAFKAAGIKLSKSGGKAGAGAEAVYAAAYQRLVTLGARLPLRKKYRP